MHLFNGYRRGIGAYINLHSVYMNRGGKDKIPALESGKVWEEVLLRKSDLLKKNLKLDLLIL